MNGAGSGLVVAWGDEPGDPRVARGFNPEWWPRCNGGEAPVSGVADAHERRCLVVLSFYYERNRWCAAAAGESGAVLEAIEARLREIEAAVEAFEDRYASVGFFGEPEMEGGFCRNVVFVRPVAPPMGPECRVESSLIAVPGLEDLPETELRGPARVVRWTHGEVDT